MINEQRTLQFGGQATNKFWKVGLLVFVLFFSGCGNGKIDEDVQSVQIDNTVYVEIGNEFELPILLFHHVGNAPEGLSADAYTWYVTDKKFEETLKLIQESGYKTLFMSEVLDYLEQGKMPEKATVLSFDDGAIDFYTNAFPLLEKYNMKASVNLMTGVRGEGWLNKEQIKELYESGLVEFGSHTRYHVYLTKILQEEAREELEKSKEMIEELLNTSAVVISYPFGLHNDEVIEIAKELGYKAGLTLHSGVVQNRDEIFEMRRIIITESKDVRKILEDI